MRPSFILGISPRYANYKPSEEVFEYCNEYLKANGIIRAVLTD